MCIHNGMDAQLFKNLIETACLFSFNLEINKKYSLTIYINIEMNTNEEEKEKVSFISSLVKNIFLHFILNVVKTCYKDKI